MARRPPEVLENILGPQHLTQWRRMERHIDLPNALLFRTGVFFFAIHCSFDPFQVLFDAMELFHAA